MVFTILLKNKKQFLFLLNNVLEKNKLEFTYMSHSIGLDMDFQYKSKSKTLVKIIANMRQELIPKNLPYINKDIQVLKN